MYAIVDIAGQQFKIEKDKKIYVHRLKAGKGAQITIDKVMLLDNNGKVSRFSLSKGVEVTATVLHHLKETKYLFQKKRRKGYQTLNEHRQHLTSLQINDIVVK